MVEAPISKALYKALSDLTGEVRIDVALYTAVKELAKLKLADAKSRLKQFEEKSQMAFDAFQKAWNEDRIPNKHSYEVEKDYWEWEAAVTDAQRLHEILERLP